MKKMCSVIGCDRFSRSLGMCQKHYHQIHRVAYRKADSERRAAYRKAYYEANKERIAARRVANVENRKAYDRSRYQKKKEEIKARIRDWAERNKDYVRQRNAERYKNNPMPAKARARKWAKENPERLRLMKAIGRERERMAEGSHDYDQLRQLRENQKGCCAVCKRKLEGKFHKDHIVPLVLGGTNWIHNIQFLCGPCNMSKNRKDPIEFMQQRGLLL